jgi:hypothetical protein
MKAETDNVALCVQNVLFLSLSRILSVICGLERHTDSVY